MIDENSSIGDYEEFGKMQTGSGILDETPEQLNQPFEGYLKNLQKNDGGLPKAKNNKFGNSNFLSYSQPLQSL